jgi:hypothetical protein
MNLIGKKTIKIGRAERVQRDDRVFVVAAEDTYAPGQYFAALPLPRVRVIVIPTPANSGLSSPDHVVTRLKEAYDDVRFKGEIQTGDEFWVMLDTDHHVVGTHLRGTMTALQQARQVGFELAISNPCFELWLLLHHIDLPAGTVFEKSADVATRLGEVLGGYNKTAVSAGRFPLTLVPDAIRRARALESNPDNPEGHWPPSTGTRVYRLMERVMGSRSS